MKTILVLSAHPDFAETIRAGLNPEQYRVVHRLGVGEAEPLLAHGLTAACILDIDLMGVEGVWIVEQLRRRASRLPVIAYTASSQSEWEEEAFLHGVTHVLTKPIRARLLNSLLERLWNAPAQQGAGGARPQCYHAFAVNGFSGVASEVDEHLFQMAAVGTNEQLRIGFNHQLHSMALQIR